MNKRKYLGQIEEKMECTFCGKEATHECGNCGIAVYCGKSCQKSHWKSNHSLVCAEIAKIGVKKRPGERSRTKEDLANPRRGLLKRYQTGKEPTRKPEDSIIDSLPDRVLPIPWRDVVPNNILPRVDNAEFFIIYRDRAYDRFFSTPNGQKMLAYRIHQRDGLEAVRQDGRRLRFFPDLQDDREVVMAAVRQNVGALEYASYDIINDKQLIMTLIGQGYIDAVLYYMSDRLKDDEEVFMEAIKEDSDALDSFSARIKDDKELLVSIAERYRIEVEYVSDRLKDDREFMLFVAKQGNRWMMEHLSRRLLNDEDVVAAAAGQNGDALNYAPADMKDNEKVVMAAVKENGSALYYASDRLKRNEKVVMAAVEQGGEALNNLWENQKDPGSPYGEGGALKYASPDMKNNEKVVMAAVKKNGLALYYASPDMQDNKQVVMAAVKENRSALEFASPRLRKDPEIRRAAGVRPINRS